MKLWQIWSEGFAVTGNEGTAHYHGTEGAETFADACARLAARDAEFGKYFDLQRLSFWGCRLFDNEAQARERFG